MNRGKGKVSLFGLFTEKFEVSICSFSKGSKEVGLVARPGDGIDSICSFTLSDTIPPFKSCIGRRIIGGRTASVSLGETSDESCG